jgi:predicted PurR-regulated permease PerM
MDLRATQIARIAATTLLVLGCLLILYPFVAAILFAAILCVVSWPLYERLLARLKQRDGLAAALMTTGLTLALLVPMILLAGSAADGAVTLSEKIRPWLQGGLQEPPDWLRNLPFLGDQINAYWHKLAGSREELMNALRQLYEPARKVLLGVGGFVGQGVIQVALVLFVSFFIYRDGRLLAGKLHAIARKLGDDLGEDMLRLSRSTVNGVMYGIVGTALGQALVALLGFLIAGVPAPMLLAAATFFLSMIPVGPPLVWGGAAIWLYNQGETGWAIFMVIYGLVVISSVDNFLKPWLISRSANLSLLLIALGVFGGILAFGFIGIFLGPTLLALGQVLVNRWLETRPGA